MFPPQNVSQMDLFPPSGLPSEERSECFRRTFSVVIVSEQAEACIIPPMWQGLQTSRNSMGPWSTTPDMGTITNGRFVKIQDGFRSRETLSLTKGVHFPCSSLSNGLNIWFPVHRSSKGQAKQRKLDSSGNSMSVISTGTNIVSLWRLKESSFVLVALNVTRHLPPHSTKLKFTSWFHLLKKAQIYLHWKWE